MQIRIRPYSEIPIYTQLIYEIKRAILKKQLSKGESMPSVRNLASDIGINMHTVNKAYKILTDEGVLVQQKKGFTVRDDEITKLEEARLKTFKDKLQEIVIDSKIFNLSKNDIDKLIEEIENDLRGDDAR